MAACSGGSSWLSRRLLPGLRLAAAVAVATSFGSVLLVEAYLNASSKTSAQPADPGQQRSVPRTVLDGGPIIDTTRRTVSSRALPKKTIALTFDDGPDERWTPMVLSVLRKHHVHATFFVLGERVAEHPELARRVVSDGHEVGLHTFTHPNLTGTTSWGHDLELSLSQLAIAGATGTTTHLVRQPYSSGPSSLDDRSWPVVRHAGRLGYLTVLADQDSRDWESDDVASIVQAASPPGDSGSVVLMHDAGGDRSRTVKALDRYIPKMLAKGYRFTTVSEGLGEPAAVAQAGGPGTTPGTAVKASVAPELVRMRGTLVLWIVRTTGWCFDLLWLAFVVVGGLTIVRTLAVLAFACDHARRRRRDRGSGGAPNSGNTGDRVISPVSVIVPAYNEAAGIEKAARSLANGDYPTIEVIVVDDGSTDGTSDVVERLGLPNVRVLRTANGGKPHALNTGIRAASHDIIVMVDGDTVFEPNSISELVQPFADPRVGAVSGNVKIGNRRSIVARWQHIEYVVGFNLDRRFYETLGCMPTVPGAIGAFRAATLRDVGGVSDDTLAEDTDLTMAICRAGWRVVYRETARAWTEAPESLGQLWRQRYRWSYGTMQAMWKHRGAVRDRSAFGLVWLPMLALFGVMMPLLAPLFDILTIFGAIAMDSGATIVAWVTMLGVQALTAVVAFRLDRERLRPLWVLPLQQFVYRQVMYLVAAKSALTAMTGARLAWHKLRRHGLALFEPASGVGAVTEGAEPRQPVVPVRGDDSRVPAGTRGDSRAR